MPDPALEAPPVALQADAGPERVVASEPPASALTRFTRTMFRLAIERSHSRVAIVGLAFAAVFGAISLRLIVVAATPADNSNDHRVAAAATTAVRPDVKGLTDVSTFSSASGLWA